jgi:hypothetical protein
MTNGQRPCAEVRHQSRHYPDGPAKLHRCPTSRRRRPGLEDSPPFGRQAPSPCRRLQTLRAPCASPPLRPSHAPRVAPSWPKRNSVRSTRQPLTHPASLSPRSSARQHTAGLCWTRSTTPAIQAAPAATDLTSRQAIARCTKGPGESRDRAAGLSLDRQRPWLRREAARPAWRTCSALGAGGRGDAVRSDRRRTRCRGASRSGCHPIPLAERLPHVLQLSRCFGQKH